MTATKDVRRRLIWAALACLVSQSGCARYRDWIWKTSGARPSLSASDPVQANKSITSTGSMRTFSEFGRD